MQELTISHYNVVSGAGGNYQMTVNLEIAQVIAAKMNNCNVKDLTASMIASALTGGVIGALGGSVTIPVVGAVPGWVSGAATGAGMAAFTYGVQCWW
ncbi:hypothetical protein [Mixta calida]|uniref:hypothetical protein n=1 Tax=Mixta calida TaxID=665913 RepID=UPI002905FA7C|nr:hypothetical protein [Mixta calida]MDU4289863.1 hypothetical protein [Mixta calida]